MRKTTFREIFLIQNSLCFNDKKYSLLRKSNSIKKRGCKKNASFFYSSFWDRKKGSEWVNRIRRRTQVRREVRFARSKKGIFSRFNEKSTKFVVLSYSAYLLDHCFFCIFQPFLRSGLFLHSLTFTIIKKTGGTGRFYRPVPLIL